MTASSEIFSRKLAGFAAYLRKQGMHVGSARSRIWRVR